MHFLLLFSEIPIQLVYLSRAGLFFNYSIYSAVKFIKFRQYHLWLGTFLELGFTVFVAFQIPENLVSIQFCHFGIHSNIKLALSHPLDRDLWISKSTEEKGLLTQIVHFNAVQSRLPTSLNCIPNIIFCTYNLKFVVKYIHTTNFRS